MKKILSLVISCSILLTVCSCSSPKKNSGMVDYQRSYLDEDAARQFSSVQDEDLLTYMENVVYYDVIQDLDSSEYCVEDVNAVYVSQEYLDELTANSKENIYFGYNLSDIQTAFGDTPWFFTVDESGQTVVAKYDYKEFEYSFFGMLKNIAIGTGVILVCVTVSLVAAPTAPAISAIAMVSAKSASLFALSSGAISAVVGGTVTYVKTGDMKQSLQAAMDSGGEGYKLGAITGAVNGAVKETLFLRKASVNLGSMNNAAIIQRETKWPADVISEIHTMDEYRALVEADLQPVLIGNRTELVSKSIDWTTKIKGETNLERIAQGKAPVDANGIAYELHHIGRESDATLALIPNSVHKKYSKVLHDMIPDNPVDHGTVWEKQKKEFYKNLTDYVTKMLG